MFKRIIAAILLTLMMALLAKLGSGLFGFLIWVSVFTAVTIYFFREDDEKRRESITKLFD